MISQILASDKTNDAVLKDLGSEEDIRAEEHLAVAEMLEHAISEREAVFRLGGPSRHIAVYGRLVGAGNNADRVVRNYRADRAGGQVRRANNSPEAVKALDYAILDGAVRSVDVGVEIGEQLGVVLRVEGQDALVRIDAVVVGDLEEVSESRFARTVEGSRKRNVSVVDQAEHILVDGVAENVRDSARAVAKEVDVGFAGLYVVERNALDVMLVKSDDRAFNFVISATPVICAFREFGSCAERVNRNLNASERTIAHRGKILSEVLQASHMLLETHNRGLGSNFNLKIRKCHIIYSFFLVVNDFCQNVMADKFNYVKSLNFWMRAKIFEEFFAFKVSPSFHSVDGRSNGDRCGVKSFGLYDFFLFLLFLRNLFFGDFLFSDFLFCGNVFVLDFLFSFGLATFVLDFLFGFGLQAFVDDFLLSRFFSNFFRNFSLQFGFVDIF